MPAAPALPQAMATLRLAAPIARLRRRFEHAPWAALVEAAAEAYSFHLARTVLVGYSNGANIGASLLLRQPGLVRGAALFTPMPLYYMEWAPNASCTAHMVVDPKTGRVTNAYVAEKLR